MGSGSIFSDDDDDDNSAAIAAEEAARNQEAMTPASASGNTSSGGALGRDYSQKRAKMSALNGTLGKGNSTKGNWKIGG